MKFKIGGNQHIEFATDVVGLSNFAPVKKSSYYLPKWFGEMKESFPKDANPKGMPNYFGKNQETAKKWSNGTAKRCPAIVDILKEGFIIPMWCDFLIQRDNKILEWDNKKFQYGIEFHPNYQIYNWKLKKNDFPEGVKFTNPWRIYTPPGYSVMFMQPTYQFEKRFTVLPGIVETDSYHHVNFPTIIHDTKDIILDRGTPFIQVIPFKRDDWDFDVNTMSQEQMVQDLSIKNFLGTKFKNAYRSITSSFNNS
jgi:hypothetical protein